MGRALSTPASAALLLALWAFCGIASLISSTGAANAQSKRVARGNPPSSSWLPQAVSAPAQTTPSDASGPDASAASSGTSEVPAKPAVRACLLCIHGLGLHHQTYAPFGLAMAQRGIATYAVDMRGFGSYRNAKGHEEVDFDGCLDDVYRSLKSIRRAQPNVPVFLLGESMGGAIALHAAARRPDLIGGLISCVPAGDRYKQGKTSLKVAMQFLKNKHKQMNVGEGVVNQATENPELRKSWINDPLARMQLSARELVQFQQFMNQNHEFARLIKDKPVLVVYGVGDKLVKPEGTKEIFGELATSDKEIYPVEGAEHLIFEESQFNPQVVEKVDQWISSHLTDAK